MTLTQALALRPGQRIVLLNPDVQGIPGGRVISNGRRVGIKWDNDTESHYDHRYMHYIHVLATTVTTRETV